MPQNLAAQSWNRRWDLVVEAAGNGLYMLAHACIVVVAAAGAEVEATMRIAGILEAILASTEALEYRQDGWALGAEGEVVNASYSSWKKA